MFIENGIIPDLASLFQTYTLGNGPGQHSLGARASEKSGREHGPCWSASGAILPWRGPGRVVGSTWLPVPLVEPLWPRLRAIAGALACDQHPRFASKTSSDSLVTVAWGTCPRCAATKTRGLRCNEGTGSRSCGARMQRLSTRMADLTGPEHEPARSRRGY